MSKLNLLVCYASGDRDHKEMLKDYIKDFKSRKLIANSEELELTHHSEDDIKTRIQAANVIVLIIGEHFLESRKCENIRQSALKLKGNKRENVAHIMLNPHVYHDGDVTILPDAKYPISNTDHWHSEVNAWDTTAAGLEAILKRENVPSSWVAVQKRALPAKKTFGQKKRSKKPYILKYLKATNNRKAFM